MMINLTIMVLFIWMLMIGTGALIILLLILRIQLTIIIIDNLKVMMKLLFILKRKYQKISWYRLKLLTQEFMSQLRVVPFQELLILHSFNFIKYKQIDLLKKLMKVVNISIMNSLMPLKSLKLENML